MSYNVRIDVDPAPFRWVDRRQTVLNDIIRVNPNILCLQESTHKVKNFIQKKLKYFKLVNCTRSVNSEEAVPIFYDQRVWKKIHNATYLFQHDTPKKCDMVCTGRTEFGHLKAKHPRIFTVLQLQSSTHKSLTIINTHFPLDPEIQKKCAMQLASFVIKIKHPVIVCGDFNCDLNGAVQLLLENGHLSDAHDLEMFPTFIPFNTTTPSGSKIDYILFRGAPLKKQTASHLISPKGSDHAAIFASFIY